MRTVLVLKKSLLLLASWFLFSLAGCAAQPDWEQTLSARLPLLGHRNFIVIADSAYPLQSNLGIDTLYAPDNPLEVIEKVLEMVRAAPHVRPIIHLDKELDFVPDAHAKGISAYRGRLQALLQGEIVKKEDHLAIIRRLDETGAVFNVILIKTGLALPYTSVFIELDAGYWGRDAENALRLRMGSQVGGYD